MSIAKEISKWLVMWAILLALLFVSLTVEAKTDSHSNQAELSYQIITPQVALVSVDGQPAEEAITAYSWFGNGFPTPQDFVVALITKNRVYVIYKSYYEVYNIKKGNK